MNAENNARFAEILDGYLKALEAGDAPDRDALLARHPDLAEELAAAFLSLDFVRGAAPSLTGEEAEPGRSLGDYRLLRELGRGGMAVVYEAEQISLGRRVALKVLPFAAVLDPKQLQRFKNEALAAAHLRHPNIVPVYGVGCERGIHYYAMQYVEGQSLAAAIGDVKGGGAGEGPKTPISSHGSNREPAYIRMAAALGLQAAEALDHAHQLGIVHRDVKPGNLLVDEAGTLWITDFGLARSLHDTGLTVTGELLGTVRYMSPEQALAKRATVDHRTDIYSLGATLYELFTLEPAFPGDDPHIVIQDIATREPVPPRKLNPALPRDLETVLLKAMSKDATSRYSTAQEMADDIERCLEDQPVLARRPSLPARAARWSRRHRTLVAASAVVLLVGVAALAMDAYRVGRALARAETNLALARDAVDKFLVEAGVAEFEDRPLPLPSRRELLEGALRFHEANLADPTSLSTRAKILHALHRYPDALEALDRALSMGPRDSRTVAERGHMLWHLGRLEEALADVDRAIAIDPDSYPARFIRGNVLASLGRAEDAIEEYREASRLHPDGATIRCALGAALGAKGDPEAAIREFREAVRRKPSHARAHQALGVALLHKGDVQEAIDELRRSISLDPDAVGSHVVLGVALLGRGDLDCAIHEGREAIRLEPDSARHNNLGHLLRISGDPDRAISSFREAIRLEPDHPLAHYNLGLACSDKGDHDGAIQANREAIRLDPGHAAAHNNLGKALESKGKVEEAIHEFREAIRLRPDWAGAHYNLGCALEATGDLDGAITELGTAIRLRLAAGDAHGGPDAAQPGPGPDIAETRCRLGGLLTLKGHLDDAIRELREAVRLKPDLAEAHINLSNALRATGDLKGALDAGLEAVRVKPSHALARYTLGNALVLGGDLDGAIEQYRETIKLQQDHAEAHCNVGYALACLGRFQEALPWLRKGHDLGSGQPRWAYPSKRWIESAERNAELEARLDQVLAGGARPQDALERIEYAEILRAKALYAEAARMYAEAFAENAALAEDFARSHRYNAACAACLAAAAGGADVAKWRGRALEWLRADLAAREANGLAATLGHWKNDPDLGAIRDRLDGLPSDEREAWAKLWADVDALLARAPKAN